MNYSREILYHRHRLSHQQINSLLEEQQNQLVFEEKLHQLSLLAGFLTLTDNLQKENIWFVPLKGPLLSYRIYGDATCRRYRDFDFLVKPADASNVIRLFCSLGFEYEKQRWPEKENERARIISRVNQLTLFNPAEHQTVEIHWRVFIDPVITFDRIEEVVRKNIQKVSFAGREMLQFSLEFELFYLIIHGGLHTWRRLKWLVDVHEIISRFRVDKKKFEELVNQFSAQRMIGLCNAMLRHFFPGSVLLPVDYTVPEWFVNYALRQANKTKDYTHNMPSYSLKHRWFYINAFPGWRYKKKRLFLLMASMKKLNYSLNTL